MVIIQSFQYGGVIRLKPSDESGSRDVKAFRDGNGRNMQMDELGHMAIRLLHVRGFPTIPGLKESAHNWARTTLLCCKCLVCGVQLGSRELGVANTHLQFPHTRTNRSFNPVPIHALYV
jgi:hypothetical protein